MAWSQSPGWGQIFGLPLKLYKTKRQEGHSLSHQERPSCPSTYIYSLSSIGVTSLRGHTVM